MYTFVVLLYTSMAKKRKPPDRNTCMIRVDKKVREEMVSKKNPGQSFGGYIRQLVNADNGYSNPDQRSHA